MAFQLPILSKQKVCETHTHSQKTKHFRWRNVFDRFDDMCGMGRGSFCS